jgi:nucleoside-diphosphate-sugar epimerase
MRFTVLGASGFIGGFLASRLAKNGHEVLRATRSELKSLGSGQLGHVFYCLGTDAARSNPHGAFEAHVAHLAGVLRIGSFASLTYLSSTRLYLGAQDAGEESAIHILPDDDNAIFNALKIAGEQLCLAIDNLNVRVVRLSNVIGFAPDGISLIPGLIKDAILRGKIRLTVSPESSKDYLDIEDVVEILPRIALGGKQRFYNVASGCNVSLAEIIRFIRSEFPCSCEWQPGSPTVVFPKIDISRIRTEFSFVPRPVLPALASTCAEFRRRLGPLAVKVSLFSDPA